MPEYTINEEQLLKTIGLRAVKPLVYKFGQSNSLSGTPKDYSKIPEPEKPKGKKSYLGNLVFAPLTFVSGSYIAQNGNVLEYDGLTLETVLFDISQTKNIVKTTVQGRAGTIKEYISDGDYQVNVKGVIVNEDNPNLYPESEVNTLIDICRASANIKVQSGLLALFSVYELVIESYNFPMGEGFQNLQTFELTCVSDSPIELQQKRE